MRLQKAFRRTDLGVPRPSKATPYVVNRSSTTALRASIQAVVERPSEAKCTPRYLMMSRKWTISPHTSAVAAGGSGLRRPRWENSVFPFWPTLARKSVTFVMWLQRLVSRRERLGLAPSQQAACRHSKSALAVNNPGPRHLADKPSS